MAEGTVLYDWAHPQQRQFARLTNLLRRKKALRQKFHDYHYYIYTELAQQRRRIKRELCDALNGRCVNWFPFAHWQRAIRWKYSDHPLCTAGSLRRGGRFNIGEDIDPALFPTFSALYAANDRATALEEALCHAPDGCGLTAHEFALASTASVLVCSVSGRLDAVLDLRDDSSLRDFVELIKDFKLSSRITAMSKKLPVAAPIVVSSVKQLMSSLRSPNWRHTVTLCEIPANGQILGQIVEEAGIDGILYRSVHTEKDCLAIFPCNFIGGTSFVQLDDDPPPTLVGPKRIDASNWEACERTADQLRNSPLRVPVMPPVATPV